MVLLIKCVPLSLIRIFRHPNLVMMSSNMNHATVVALQSLTSLASSHLVKYFVAMIIYLAPVHLPCGFIGPTKSIAHFANAYRVSCAAKGIPSLLGSFPTLWHTSQAL
jgi:hypothetical protein